MNIHFPSYLLGVFGFLFISIPFAILLGFLDERDKKIEAAAEAYETCIESEFGRSVQEVYENIRYYPECRHTQEVPDRNDAQKYNQY